MSGPAEGGMSDPAEGGMSDTPAKPLPHPDRDSRAYWEALGDGRFCLQRCRGCGALRWPPREPCNRCLGWDSEWVDVEPTGRILSWVRTHQVFAPAYRDEVPYTTVQVALDAQPDILMIGGWRAERSPRWQEPVRIEWVEAGGGFRLPCWRPA